MPRSVEGFLSDSTDPIKELTRKLYWAVSSTLPLSRDQKKTSFTWAANLAERIAAAAAARPPPASRSNGLTGKALAMEKKRGYAAPAGGGAAGSSDPIPSGNPSERMRSWEASQPAGEPSAAQAAFVARMAAARTEAEAYMVSENVRLGITGR